MTAIAAIDLRRSTLLADELRARKTYLMAHTLLPTLAHVCEKMSGSVMNFRGDGLFASFQLKKKRVQTDNPTQAVIETAHREAVVCGLALIEATQGAVEPILRDEGIDVSLDVGVGVDSGEVVVTRVGWMSAHELTAYGTPVNTACHLSDGTNCVRLSPRANEAYPSSPGGKLRMSYGGGGYEVLSTSRKLEYA